MLELEGLGHALEGWGVGIGQSPGQFQSASPALRRVVSKCVHTLHEWSLGFLQPSCKSHWFLNQIRELIFPVLDPRAGPPICGLDPSIPREDL